MINCFIDPIFLAINDRISSKYYSEVIYPNIFEFYQRIEEIESKNNQRVKFNITFEFIVNCMNYNPYNFSSNILCRNWFRRFLSYFLKQHRNSSCDIISIDNNNINLQYLYENQNVPLNLIEIWCKFLNSCSNCKNCKDKNLDLLSHESLGSRSIPNSPDFFERIIYDLISWLDEQFNSMQIETQPPVVEIQPDLKKIGDWSHSHPKIVMKEIDKLLDFRFIRGIKPTGKTRGINKNRIIINSFNQYNVFISDKKGVHIFIIYTSARNESEGEKILNELSTLLSDYEIRS